MVIPVIHLFFLKDFIYSSIFIEGEGREKERVRNIDAREKHPLVKTMEDLSLGFQWVSEL